MKFLLEILQQLMTDLKKKKKRKRKGCDVICALHFMPIHMPPQIFETAASKRQKYDLYLCI